MSISIEDVRHIATLARLGLTDERAVTIVAELRTILAHMAVLSSVDTTGIDEAVGVGHRGLSLRADVGPPIEMTRPLDSIAPSLRDGLLLVPRLDSHESSEDA